MSRKSDVKEAELKKAHEAACEARLRAYAPYSKFPVGAALILDNGEMFPGCNVENASFGGTVCAERTAILSAVAKHGGKIRPKALVLVTDPMAMPCGLCLQVMAEFCSPEMLVYVGTPKGPGKSLTLKELLPNTFDAGFLKK